MVLAAVMLKSVATSAAAQTMVPDAPSCASCRIALTDVVRLDLTTVGRTVG
jgi:hypothetical protein